MLDWFASPVTAQDRPRDELAIKLALAVTVPGVDVAAVIQRQRVATIASLQDLTRLKRGQGEDLSWSLVVEWMRYRAEAEVRWLDHCETTLARVAHTRDVGPSKTSPASEAQSDTQGVRR